MPLNFGRQKGIWLFCAVIEHREVILAPTKIYWQKETGANRVPGQTFQSHRRDVSVFTHCGSSQDSNLVLIL